MNGTNSRELIYHILRRVPAGKVTTYGALARAAGSSPRATAAAMARNFSSEVPCHRVVAHNGGISGYNRGVAQKIRLLKQEGVAISGKGSSARVDLERFELIL